MTKPKTDAEKRTTKIYDAEWAAGTAVLRPLRSVEEAQALVNYVLKSRWWKKTCGIKVIKVEYIPKWEFESEMEDRRTTGTMRLSMGNLSEGVVLHELAHCARGDVDNSHPPEFCAMLLELLERFTRQVVADRLREELHLRKLI
jgi:hypothetical protein